MRAWRRDRLMKGAVLFMALPALLLPAACLLYIFWRGASVLGWDFIATGGEGVRFGASTGVLPQLLGSLMLALGACLLAAPLALGTALYHRLYAGAAQRRILDSMMGMLQGIPPIVFGLCGLIVFVHLLRWGVSLASGALILALVVLPLMVANMVAALARVPLSYTDAARSLGLSDLALIWRVWLPQSWAGVLTALLLAVARSLSETAPILFTATVFSGVQWPHSIFQPVTSLQTHIFYLAQEGADPHAVTVAWGSAAVLVLLVLLFSLAAHLLKYLGERSWSQK